ncbi:hypothetical protein NUW58_g1620 [Xylaria curta]|uniref:Uncharacterized protein n=1 Tax=Xylaria curta TaxID=42375 RepID=A0ACC1PM90_9PEZI|nr:hypothetical protein NUW58_g1620 [Xylaria curta]
MADPNSLTTAALPPPRGIEPNFVDPFNRGPIYIILAGIFLTLPTVSVGIRLWARFIIQRSPWWDDVVCVLALTFQAAYVGLSIWLCLNGVGKHLWNVYLVDFLQLINPARVLADITELSIGLTKLALLLLYYRLFWPNLSTRIGIYIGIAFVIAIYGSLFFLFVFLDVRKTAATNITIAIANVLSDFYILVLPITAVLQLHLTRKKRLGLITLFSTGFSVCVLSIAGAIYRFRFALDGTDFTWGLIDVITLNTIECSVGIICACLPFFPVVFTSSTILEEWIISMRSLRRRFLSHGETHSLSSISQPVKADCEAGSIDTEVVGNGERAATSNDAVTKAHPMHLSTQPVELTSVPNAHSMLTREDGMGEGRHASVLYSARVMGNGRPRHHKIQHSGIEAKQFYGAHSPENY